MTDREFKTIWSTIVIPQYLFFSEKYPGLFICNNAEQDLLSEYNDLISYCKTHYMRNASKLVDRHKVCAAIMISILKIEPIKMNSELYNRNSYNKWLFNEKIAISVGLSLLCSFLIKIYEDSPDIVSRLEHGIIYPKTNHGEFINNFATELYYLKKENSFSILSLANELFLLEKYTLNNSNNQI